MTILLVSIAAPVIAQSPVEQAKLNIRKIDKPIKLDGILDEKVWSLSDSAYNFFQNFLSDTSLSIVQKRVYIHYDDNFIYIGAKITSPKGEKGKITPSLRRDFREEANNGFSVILMHFKIKQMVSFLESIHLESAEKV